MEGRSREWTEASWRRAVGRSVLIPEPALNFGDRGPEAQFGWRPAVPLHMFAAPLAGEQDAEYAGGARESPRLLRSSRCPRYHGRLCRRRDADHARRGDEGDR